MRKLLLSLILLIPICSLADDEVDIRDSAQEAVSSFEAKGDNFERFQKFSILLDENGLAQKIVYQNQKKFDRHADFLKTLPEFSGMSLKQIDAATYNSNPRRMAILGVVTRRSFDDAIIYNHFNIVTAEAPTATQIEMIYKLILKTTKGDWELMQDTPLKFEPLAHQQTGMATLAPILREKGIEIAEPQIEPTRIPYTDAWNMGTLQWIGSIEEFQQKLENGLINSDTIIATDQNLREFPPVAGMISALKLTQSSHQVYLAQMYSAPLVYIKDAVSLFKDKSGQRVLLIAHAPPGSNTSERSILIQLNPSESDIARLKELKTEQLLPITIDENPTAVVSARKLSRTNISAYGGKSSQMGLILNTIPEFTLSEAGAIPVSYFKRFLKTALVSTHQSLERYIEQKLNAIPVGQENSATARSALKEIRSAIKSAKIPAPLLAKIVLPLKALFPGNCVRLKLRSSSNVEDGAKFNGAGLYDSFGTSFNCPEKPDEFEKDLKKVWASLYTQRGFVARRQFKVDETKAAMGVLVHPPFKGELHNGVASLFVSASGDSSSFEVVTLPGGDEEQGSNDAVTHSNGEMQAEVVSVSHDQVRVIQPYEGNSSKQTLMAKEYYLQLEQAMKALFEKYREHGQDTHIEAEWKQMPGNTNPVLRIKQVRPVPRNTVQKARDGSSYIFVTGEEVAIPDIDMPNDASDALFAPRQIRIRMKTFSENELSAKRISIGEISYLVQGKVYSIKSPKFKVSEDEYYQRITIPLKHPALKTIALSMEIQKGDPRAIQSTNSISYRFSTGKADVKFYTHFGGNEGMNNYFSYREPTPLDEIWEDPTVIGKGVQTISVTGGTFKIKIRLTDVKERGKGDGRQTKIGHASIEGLLQRPIEIPAIGIGYGANHHSSIENYAFDLFSDSRLSDEELKWLSENVGRYVYLDASNMQGDAPSVTLIHENGRAKKNGRFKIKVVKSGEVVATNGENCGPWLTPNKK